MPITDKYVEQLIPKLTAVRPVTYRKMFGGLGLYCDGIFFAVADDDKLYFKVDDQTVGNYKGCEAWVPDPKFGPMSYREVSKKMLADPKLLGERIDEAVEVAKRKKAKKK